MTETTKTKNSVCEGCLLYSEYHHCGIMPTFDNEDCPCLTCIIKMVCRQICPELTQYKDKYEVKNELWNN